jgi:hypothetical protein
MRTLARILELAAAESADWVVLRRAVDWQPKPLLYVYRLGELEALRRKQPALAHAAAEDALELREAKASAESSDRKRPASAPPGDKQWPSAQRIVHAGQDERPDAIGEIARDEKPGPGPKRGGRFGTTRGGESGAPAAPSPAGGGVIGGAAGGVAVGGGTSGSIPFDLGPMRSAGPKSAGAAAPGDDTVDIELSAQAPEEIKVDDEDVIDIQVALAGVVPALANVARAVAKGDEKIVALLSIQGDALAAVGPKLLRLDVPTAAKPSSQKAFGVRAVREGVAQVAVIFQQGGSELGTVPFKLRAVTAQPSGEKVKADATAAPRDPADDGVVLLLIEEKLLAGGGLCYNYKLVSDRLEWDHVDFDSPPLKDEGGGAAANARRYVDSVYKRMTERVLANYDDVKAFAREVKAMGADLSLQLFPSDLVRELWDKRDKLGTVHVKSWEPYIPWEIIRLKHPDSGATDDRFLAEYSLVRSLNGTSRPARLALGSWRYLAAEYPNGSEQPLTAEKALFTDVLDKRAIKAVPIKADPNDVYDALNQPDFDVLHISCHGKAEHENIEQSVLIIGDRKVGGEVKPVMLDPTTVREEAKFAERHPLVFLNACESGRLGRSLTAWGGWPRTFWDAGASAFVGTSWSVRDKPAKDFCEAFYGTLIDGKTLAEAAGAGRAAIKDKGDATWLAYKVYGRPTARKA